MGFWSFLNRKITFGQVAKDKEVPGPNFDRLKKPFIIDKSISIEKVKKRISPVLFYAHSFGRKTKRSDLAYEGPQYDLSQINRIEDVEAYFMQGNLRKQSTMFKQGWELTGKNPETIAYIRKRFRELDVVIDPKEEGFFDLITSTGADLIKFSNAFWVKIRDEKASSGNIRKTSTEAKLKPIATYFGLPPETVRYAHDNDGHLIGIEQETPDGRTRVFDLTDIIHFTYNKKRGLTIGTPILVPLIDDIKALREIEENVEILLHQYIFPLFHYMVGTEKEPAGVLPTGEDEVEVVEQKLRELPPEGAIVTPHRHKIEAVGFEGKAIAAEKYLNHFRERIFGGQGLSAVDLGIGDSSNRATSLQLSKNLIDTVKFIQQIYATQFNRQVMYELLLESDFPDPLSEDNIVELKFNEIDTDAMIKIQNHAGLMFQGNMLGQHEARHQAGYKPIEPESESELFLHKIEEPKIQLQKRILTEESAAKAAMQAKQQPSNQHGKALGPTPRQSSLEEKLSKDNVVSAFSTTRAEVYTRIQLNQGFSGLRSILISLSDNTKDNLVASIISNYASGAASIGAMVQGSHANSLIAQGMKDVDRLFDDILIKIKSPVEKNDWKEAGEILDSLEYRARLIDYAANRRAFIWGQVQGYKSLGYNKVRTIPKQGSEHKSQVIDLSGTNYLDFPPFHSSCKCGIEGVK